MLVTHVNKYYLPHVGGIENVVRDTAEGLLRFTDWDARVLVANEGRARVEETVRGVPVTRLPRALAYSSTPVALGLPGAIRRAGAASDVMHLHFPYPWGDVSWLAARPGCPTVMSYHSDIVRQKRMLALYRPLLERVLDRIDLLLVTSPNMLAASPFLAARAEKCRFVPYGMELTRFEPTPELVARAEELKDGHSRPVVLFVGRLIYYKGAEVLVRAMADVEADLVIVGRGPLEPELRSLADELGISERLTFLPHASDADLAAWYRAADVFCLPSVAPSEAFGLVQVEAHASGTPVVSTRLGTSVEWVNQDGVTGFIAEPGDAAGLSSAIGRLLADDSLRTRLGEQARDRALREFTVERMVCDTVRVYAEAMEGK